jgi:glycosyltransferase involved in cell wall biosynthesis
VKGKGMRVLLIHNHYIQPGGEDTVFKAEWALLERYGHEVITFVEDNARLNTINPVKVAVDTIWSKEAQWKIRKLIEETKPDVAHFHNTFLRVSPAAYYTCKDAGIPVIQTLHNYRLLCPGSLLMRNGHVCENCLKKKVPWPGVIHGCWRNSKVGTALVATMLVVHRLLRTWTDQVDVYVALTEFARRKFIEGGLPAEKIVVKPNFVYPDPGRGEHKGNFALFVGRLSAEKGVRTLLSAWRLLKDISLKIVGNGSLMTEVKERVRRERLTIEVLGWRPREEVFALMQAASFLLFPSECYEGFPMAIVEAFACGLPVVASRLGAMAEIVEDGRTGLLFEPGNPKDLAAKVEWLLSHPQDLAQMSKEARAEYEAKYTAERNYEMLMAIYHRVLGRQEG